MALKDLLLGQSIIIPANRISAEISKHPYHQPLKQRMEQSLSPKQLKEYHESQNKEAIEQVFEYVEKNCKETIEKRIPILKEEIKSYQDLIKKAPNSKVEKELKRKLYLVQTEHDKLSHAKSSALPLKQLFDKQWKQEQKSRHLTPVTKLNPPPAPKKAKPEKPLTDKEKRELIKFKPKHFF